MSPERDDNLQPAAADSIAAEAVPDHSHPAPSAARADLQAGSGAAAAVARAQEAPPEVPVIEESAAATEPPE